MSTTTASSASAAAFKLDVAPRAGVLRRFFEAIVDARTRQAQRRIAAYLAAMDDDLLKGWGFSTAEIEWVRAGKPVGDILAQRSRQRR